MFERFTITQILISALIISITFRIHFESFQMNYNLTVKCTFLMFYSYIYWRVDQLKNMFHNIFKK